LKVEVKGMRNEGKLPAPWDLPGFPSGLVYWTVEVKSGASAGSAQAHMESVQLLVEEWNGGRYPFWGSNTPSYHNIHDLTTSLSRACSLLHIVLLAE
jgi:hypothetical protein